MFGKLDIKNFSPLFLLGFLGMVIQISILREFTIYFSGNELVIGLGLFFWMTLTAFGNMLTRFFDYDRFLKNDTSLLLGLLSFLAFLTLLISGYVRYHFFIIGTIPGIQYAVFLIPLFLLPLCLVNGLSFGVLNKAANRKPGGKTSISYGVESLGAVAGGLFVFFISGTGISNTWIIRIGFILTAISVLIMMQFNYRHIISFSIMVIAGISLFLADPEAYEKQYLYPGQQILESRDSHYGRIAVTKSHDQINIYQDGQCAWFSGNTMINEEKVHFAMLQHPSPGRILVISGGASGIISEISKYKPERIDYVEENYTLLDAIYRYTDSFDKVSGLKVHNSEPRKYLNACTERYDVILVDAPEPLTIRSNRFFSREFFSLIHKNLHPGGIFAFPLLSPSGYISANTAEVLSIVNSTLKSVFQKVLIIPGNHYYFLAGDSSSLSPSIAALYSLQNIENEFVNPYYIDDALLHERSQEIVKSLKDQPLNHDHFPRLVYFQLTHFLSQFKVRLNLILAGMVIFLLIIFLMNRRRDKGMFVMGFTSVSVEIMAIVIMQAFIGSIYLYISLFFAVFMGGLFAGTALSATFLQKIRMPVKALPGGMVLLILICIALMASGFMGGVEFMEWVLLAILLIIVGIAGLTTGLYFSWCSEKSDSTGVSHTYSADLWGSAAGSLFASCIIIPLGGLFTLAVFLTILCLTFIFFPNFTRTG